MHNKFRTATWGINREGIEVLLDAQTHDPNDDVNKLRDSIKVAITNFLKSKEFKDDRLHGIKIEQVKVAETIGTLLKFLEDRGIKNDVLDRKIDSILTPHRDKPTVASLIDTAKIGKILARAESNKTPPPTYEGIQTGEPAEAQPVRTIDIEQAATKYLAIQDIISSALDLVVGKGENPGDSYEKIETGLRDTFGKFDITYIQENKAPLIGFLAGDLTEKGQDKGGQYTIEPQDIERVNFGLQLRDHCKPEELATLVEQRVVIERFNDILKDCTLVKKDTGLESLPCEKPAEITASAAAIKGHISKFGETPRTAIKLFEPKSGADLKGKYDALVESIAPGSSKQITRIEPKSLKSRTTDDLESYSSTSKPKLTKKHTDLVKGTNSGPVR